MNEIRLGDSEHRRRFGKYRLIASKSTGVGAEVYASQKMRLGGGEASVVVVLHIMCSHQYIAVINLFQHRAAVQPLKEDGTVVLSQVCDKLVRRTRLYYIRSAGEGAPETSHSWVISNLATVIPQCLLLATSILKSMQMNLQSQRLQRLEAIEDVDYTTIIGGVRDIERDDVEHWDVDMLIC